MAGDRTHRFVQVDGSSERAFAGTQLAIRGLRDSKLLTLERREAH